MEMIKCGKGDGEGEGEKEEEEQKKRKEGENGYGHIYGGGYDKALGTHRFNSSSYSHILSLSSSTLLLAASYVILYLFSPFSLSLHLYGLLHFSTQTTPLP